MTKETISQSDDDLRLMHTLFSHVMEEAFFSLIVAIEEAEEGKDDPRFVKLQEGLLPIIEQLLALVNVVIDEIPGALSEKEAQELVDEVLTTAALLQGFPADALLPDPEVFN